MLEKLLKIQNKTVELLIDLGWEMQRMSSSGKESLEELWRIWEIPTDNELEIEDKQNGK